MVTKVQRWGNSQGLRIARQLLEEARICVGDEVDVTAKDGAIVVRPVRRIRGRVRLEDLVSRIPKDYKAREISWGSPVGREEW